MIMQRRQFISHVLELGVAVAAASCVTGCGTLIHSERSGQPHSNQIDWKMAALDGLGLLLFFIPGVVAFVVDFSTGAIYLPLEPSYPVYEINPQQPAVRSGQEVSIKHSTTLRSTDAILMSYEPCHSIGQPRGLSGLKRLAIPREQLEQSRIEEIATRHVGQPVSLNDGQTRLSVLPCLEQFDEQASRHRADRKFGFAVRSFFERLKQRSA